MGSVFERSVFEPPLYNENHPHTKIVFVISATICDGHKSIVNTAGIQNMNAQIPHILFGFQMFQLFERQLLKKPVLNLLVYLLGPLCYICP